MGSAASPELPNLLNLIGNPYWLTLTADIIRLGGGPAGSRNQLLATWVNHVSTCTSAPGAEEEEESAPRLSAEVLQALAMRRSNCIARLGMERSSGVPVGASVVQAHSQRVRRVLLGEESPFLEKEQLLVAERHAPARCSGSNTTGCKLFLSRGATTTLRQRERADERLEAGAAGIVDCAITVCFAATPSRRCRPGRSGTRGGGAARRGTGPDVHDGLSALRRLTPFLLQGRPGARRASRTRIAPTPCGGAERVAFGRPSPPPNTHCRKHLIGPPRRPTTARWYPFPRQRGSWNGTDQNTRSELRRSTCSNTPSADRIRTFRG